jgi:hypothetical protein
MEHIAAVDDLSGDSQHQIGHRSYSGYCGDTGTSKAGLEIKHLHQALGHTIEHFVVDIGRVFELLLDLCDTIGSDI